MNSARGLAIVFLLVAAGVGVYRYVILTGQDERHDRQISNCDEMQEYVTMLSAYHSAHGRYPASLGDAVDTRAHPKLAHLTDSYGHAVRYETNGNQFVLVSYGNDGKPETKDYWPYRTKSVMNRTLAEEQFQCAAGADVIFTDQGCYRCCGQ